MLPTRDLLLRAAKKVFAAKGYESATVKELADAAGVNVSLVSYYFEGKEGLYRACLEQFGKERLDAAARVLKPADSPEDFRVRLRLFIEELLLSFTEDSDVALIVHRERTAEGNPMAHLWPLYFGKVFSMFHGFVESAQKRGILRPDLHPHASAVLMFSSILGLARSDRLEVWGGSLKDPAYREAATTDAVRIFTQGLFAR